MKRYVRTRAEPPAEMIPEMSATPLSLDALGSMLRRTAAVAALGRTAQASNAAN